MRAALFFAIFGVAVQLSPRAVRPMGKKHPTMDSEQTKQIAFEQFAAEHRRLIGKICCMYASDTDHWQDLCQEVLINLWRGFGTFEGRAKASSWVWRIALNTCITDYRRNRRRASSTLPLALGAGIADEESPADERLHELYRLIERLERLDRAVVMLWLDEHSYDEIASITGLTRNNVASRLHRIREKLTRLANH